MRSGVASVLLAALLLAAPARAQDQARPPAVAPFPEIVDQLARTVVSVRAEPPMTDEDPWALVGLNPQDHPVLSVELAQTVLRRALATGTFLEVALSARATGEGVELILRGARRWTLSGYELRGVFARPYSEVEQELGLRRGAAMTDAEVRGLVNALRESYIAAGFDEARVNLNIRDTARPGERVAVVEVNEGPPRRVREVVVEGVSGDLVGVVRGAVPLSPGATADRRRLRTSRELVGLALRRAGYLSARVTSVDLRSGEGDLDVVVSVVPGDRYRTVVQGARAFEDEDLVAALRLDEERDFDDAALGGVVQRLRDFYVRRAFRDARVSARVDREGEGRKVLRVTVVEGPQVFVDQVTFPGATVFTTSELRAALEGSLRGTLPDAPRPLWGRLDPAHTLVRSAWDDATTAVSTLYRERGYLDAQATLITPLTERPDPECADGYRLRGEAPWRFPCGPRVAAEVRVEEGERTMLEELVFDGNRVVSSATLAEQAELRLGVPISFRALEEARGRLTDYLREEGYAFARVDPSVERSPDHRRARARIDVREGARVRVAAVEVRGNERTLTDVILSRLALRPGDVYTVSAVRLSQRRLSELGVFAGVNISLESPDTESPTKTVVVQVVERLPQSLEVRGGFTTGEGVRAGFEYVYGNLFRRAISVSASARIGRLIQIPGLTPAFPDQIQPTPSQLLNWRLSLSIGSSYLPVLGPVFGWSVDVSSVRLLQPPYYALTTFGLGLTLSARPLTAFSLTFTPELQYVSTEIFGANSIQQLLTTQVDQCVAAAMPAPADEPTVQAACRLRFEPLRQQLLRVQEGDSIIGALRLVASVDRRNSALNPTRGWYLSATAELLRVFSVEPANDNLARSTVHILAKASGYIPLPALDMVLLLSLRAGGNISLDGGRSTHASRLFWLGGADSMRAWLQNQLIPEDVVESVRNLPVNQRTDSLLGANGGEFFVNAIIDLRIPWGFCPFGGVCIASAVFADLGNVWTRFPSPEQIITRLRFAPGTGIRVTTPVGTIALDVGFNPFARTEVNENTWALQFSLGTL